MPQIALYDNRIESDTRVQQPCALPSRVRTLGDRGGRSRKVSLGKCTLRAMRLICWNMEAGYQYDPGKHRDAWAWLNEQDLDIALLQEVVLTGDLNEKWGSVLHAGKDPNRRVPWDSAVLVTTPGYRLYSPTPAQPWLRQFSGSACVAEPPTVSDLPWLISLHSNSKPLVPTYFAEQDLDGVARCSPRGVWEIDLLTHELGTLLADRRFVAGGDLNGSLLFDVHNRRRENEAMFDNLRNAGLIDTRPRRVTDEQQTFFRIGSRPYQLDHVFADEQTEPQVTRWQVLTDIAAVHHLSDHAPVVIETQD